MPTPKEARVIEVRTANETAQRWLAPYTFQNFGSAHLSPMTKAIEKLRKGQSITFCDTATRAETTILRTF